MEPKKHLKTSKPNTDNCSTNHSHWPYRPQPDCQQSLHSKIQAIAQKNQKKINKRGYTTHEFTNEGKLDILSGVNFTQNTTFTLFTLQAHLFYFHWLVKNLHACACLLLPFPPPAINFTACLKFCCVYCIEMNCPTGTIKLDCIAAYCHHWTLP